MNFLKRAVLKVLFGNRLTRPGVKFPKKSYIREHAHIKGGKYITLGTNCRILQYSRIMCFDYISGVKQNPQLIIGNNCTIGRNVTISCSNYIEIQEDTMIAGYCFVCDSNHGMNPEFGKRYEKQPLDLKKVIIGKNCWLGDKVMVLPGVTIGDNCIIGAGSIVTKDIPSNCVAVGNPAKIIKKYDYDSHEWKKV